MFAGGFSPGGCGTFYAINVASPAFIGISKVKQHRLVNEILKEEIAGIHGLTVRSFSVDCLTGRLCRLTTSFIRSYRRRLPTHHPSDPYQNPLQKKSNTCIVYKPESTSKKENPFKVLRVRPALRMSEPGTQAFGVQYLGLPVLVIHQLSPDGHVEITIPDRGRAVLAVLLGPLDRLAV